MLLAVAVTTLVVRFFIGPLRRRATHRPRALAIAQAIEVPPCQRCGMRPPCLHDGYNPVQSMPEPSWARPVPMPEQPVSCFSGGESFEPIREHGISARTPRRPFVRRPPATSIPRPGVKMSC